MTYRPKPYSEVKADRQAAILAGEKVGIPKGICHFCHWELPKPALYCSADCAHGYMVERAELLRGK